MGGIFNSIKMKKYLFLSLSLVLALSACKKEEEDDQTNGTTEFSQELVVAGTKYTLGSGFMEYYPDYGVNSENLDLFLLSDGVTIHFDSDNYPDSISGNGYLLYFEMFSADSTYLSNGTYVMDSTLTVNTFSSSSLAQVVNGEVNSFDDLNSGTVEVSRDDNVYTITGSGKDANNRDFSFKFKKALVIY